ncbi:hypothetical protein ACFX11_004421 [Malus domestica]
MSIPELKSLEELGLKTEAFEPWSPPSMASMATLFVNTPYPSHSFPKPSSAHFSPVLKLSTYLGSKLRTRQRL